MPVRTAYAGAAISGEVLTAANVNKGPGGWLGREQVTANQTGITTATDLTSLTVTVTVGSSRCIRVKGHVTALSTVAGDSAQLLIMEGATQLQGVAVNMPVTAITTTLDAEAILTPTAGAHTYKLQMARPAGSGTLTMGAGASSPAFITVEDIGPAS